MSSDAADRDNDSHRRGAITPEGTADRKTGLRIRNRMTGPYARWIEADIERLLMTVPHDDLVGLDEIAVADALPRRGQHVAAGLYRRRWSRGGWQRQPARIDLAFDGIYLDMPRWLFRVPFVRRLMLANILYHEIGHHVHRVRAHGVSKGDQEEFAERYARAQLKHLFTRWRPLIAPFARLALRLGNRGRAGTRGSRDRS
jgi:hypothetical protein